MVARGVIGHSSVMRDLLFSQRVTRDFPLRFPSWLISFQTTSRDIKNTIFSRSSTSDFIRSNDNRIPLNVVNILFHFSVICDRFSPPLSPPPNPLAPCNPTNPKLCSHWFWKEFWHFFRRRKPPSPPASLRHKEAWAAEETKLDLDNYSDHTYLSLIQQLLPNHTSRHSFPDSSVKVKLRRVGWGHLFGL